MLLYRTTFFNFWKSRVAAPEVEKCSGVKREPRRAKIRLDILLVEKGLFESREKAQRAILAGSVHADGILIDKPGSKVLADSALQIREKDRYVSRGGLKLEAALVQFGLNPAGAICLDVGASTGGFTDCLLQHGASRVYAYDVGHGQLDWKIRSDPRVVVREKLNARYLQPDDVPEPVSFCVIDVSFISLTLILPPVAAVLGRTGASPSTMIVLIKPQFELERSAVGRGGIVRDAEAHARAVEKVRRFVEQSLLGWRWTGVMDSPILGTEGNKEFLACLQN